ncbi:sulfotransferase domain-containing protein [Vibrio aestuarianus]|uniref:Sulfotransferase domain-containing protein n=1 Tax=Vibrio aestuarianus TaxID=28171 RepID=A0AAX3U1C5_9VIBR|nr:sulfotransferase domain-containing protein [Vibrio aestuarianus]WGK81282.1 sulfotransferase domain-containing protein [Vibrio aestuarianus]
MKKISMFGAPRSGTSWLSQIFNSNPNVALRFQPLFSYGHKSAITQYSKNEEIERFFWDILNTNDEFALMKAPMFKNFPRFDKGSIDAIVFKETKYLDVSEALLENSDTKVIAIIRNPLSVLASWIKAPKEFDPDWNILEEWRDAKSKNRGPEDYYGFNKWVESTLMFHQLANRYPEQCLIVDYTELKNNTLPIVSSMFDFCGLSVEQQTFDFITASKSRHDTDPYSVYRSKSIGEAYKNTLPKVIIETVTNELADTILEKYIL